MSGLTVEGFAIQAHRGLGIGLEDIRLCRTAQYNSIGLQNPMVLGSRIDSQAQRSSLTWKGMSVVISVSNGIELYLDVICQFCSL